MTREIIGQGVNFRMGNYKDKSELKVHISERIQPKTIFFLERIQKELKRLKLKANRAAAIEKCVDYCQWAHDEHNIDVLNFK